MKKNKKIVFVGLSGGVDSSVSAALLKDQGYDVVGVFIKVWQPDFITCTWREERRDAMRVAAALDIPFLTFDLEKEYKKEVADYMISEYKTGRTPNPDVMCNKKVKFGGFLKKALSMGADFVATGHYARVVSQAKLLKGVDPAKDQSYFLWTLNQDQLKHTLFPIGHLKKTQVRKLAEKYRLHTFEKKDSQGVCFLGQLDMKDFLKHFIKEKKGKVLNEKGEIIGEHDGAVFFTLGERHGFTITKKTNHDKPYYVVDKDIKKNTITVSQDSNRHILTNGSIDLESTNWIIEPDQNKTYQAQIRYHGEFLPCKIKCSTPSVQQVIFEKPILAASGQSVVLYDGNICLGGGVIK